MWNCPSYGALCRASDGVFLFRSDDEQPMPLKMSTCFMARRLVKMTPVIQLQTNNSNYSYFQKDTQILLENNLDRT